MTPAVRTLLIANVGAYFLQQVLPGVMSLFVFVPPQMLVRPWAILTYMFLHGNLMHLFFNMLGLFFFGPRIEDRLGTRRFSWLYVLSGLTGALLSVVFAPNAALIGASAGVFGVMLAFAYFWPHAPIMIWGIIPVPARVLVIITTLLALFSQFGGARDGVAHMAHLGGYIGSFLYLKWIERAAGAYRRRVTAAPPEANQAVSKWRDIDRSRIHEVNREEVDRLLDKINATGIDSLTAQERIFLSNFVPADDRTPPVS